MNAPRILYRHTNRPCHAPFSRAHLRGASSEALLVYAHNLALLSPPGQWRSMNSRTAPRLDQKLRGRHDRPVQSLSLLSLSFFVFRRARPIRPAPSRSLALSRAAALSFSLPSYSVGQTQEGGCQHSVQKPYAVPGPCNVRKRRAKNSPMPALALRLRDADLLVWFSRRRRRLSGFWLVWGTCVCNQTPGS